MTPTVPTPLELEPLLGHRAERCVSIFLPTHRSGPEVRQDPIRLKNLLARAERELAARGTGREEIETLLEPARELLDRTEFWTYQKDGLALFLAPGAFHERSVPLALDEEVIVDDRFAIRQLLPLLVGDGRFFVFALSQSANRLYEATRHAIVEVSTPDVPESLEVAMRFDDPESQLQFRSGTGVPAVGGQRQAAAFHGHGVGVDDEGSNLLRYCQQIDRGLETVLARERAPLVLAAVESVAAVFRRATSYPHVMADGIDGNPDLERPEDLLERAWTIVEPRFAAELDRALERYGDLASGPRASSHAPEVVAGAAQGRVETLFLARDQRLLGRFDAASGLVELGDGGDEARDLLEVAARHTVANGGTVYQLARERIPNRETAAAIFRY